MRHLRLALFAALAPVLAVAADHVVLISIDGMMPRSYLQPDNYGLKIPTLRSMVKDGCACEGIEPVFPSVTYPNHTTMVTGRSPADHGIVANMVLDPFNLTNGGWYWYAETIKVPVLWDVARAAGKKTAAVGWPVTVGAAVDWNIPEYREVRTPDDMSLYRALSTPGLLREVEKLPGIKGHTDNLLAHSAAHILTKYRPNLLLLHIVELDDAQHHDGPLSPPAVATLERLDALVGMMVSEAKKAGMADKTAWVIVSDHGFRKVEKAFHPGAALRSLGLIQNGADGKLKDWKAWARTDGGGFALTAKDAGDTQTIRMAERYFRTLAQEPSFGIGKLFGKEELQRMGANPDAFLAGSAAPGFTFGGATEGPMMTDSGTTHGTHGYDPADPELRASLILYGAGVTPCRTMPAARMLDVAPTVSGLMGISMPSARGRDLRSR